MRLPPALIGHTEEVLREILRFTGPADNTLSRYFRDHPRLGSRERGVVAEAVYGLLRNKLVYTGFAESGQGPSMRRLALLGLADAAGTDALGGLSPEETDWLNRVMQIDRNMLPAALRANLPQWLYDRFLERFGEEET
ncbi:MAG: SAM-dependent methyltransferase, partial [Burkholderiaceae bacterium]